MISGGNTQSMTSFNSKAPGSPNRRMSPTGQSFKQLGRASPTAANRGSPTAQRRI